MRLVQLQSADGWALIDEKEYVLRHLSGGLPIWGPRIAGGEGVWALPVNGRTSPVAARDLDAGRLFRRVFRRGETFTDAGVGLAAVVGVTLTGRRNPIRSLCGCVAVAEAGEDLRFGPVLVTRDEFGDEPPEIFEPMCGAMFDAAGYLEALDREQSLATGDVVVLGSALLPTPLRARLQARELMRHDATAADSHRNPNQRAPGSQQGSRARL